MQKFQLSQVKIDELRQELDYARGVLRGQIGERVETARAFGDLSENAEYHAAREAQAKNEGRIQEIEGILKGAVVVERRGSDIAELGAEVTLKKIGADVHQVYTLVTEHEADMAQGRLSVTSPLGSCVIGKKSGDTCQVETPRGTTEYEIISIT
jgi:transcription elongation factor GreA